jgi:pyruvate dehydrogenase E2 component (dihydrolipoamide acetyltransferase)
VPDDTGAKKGVVTTEEPNRAQQVTARRVAEAKAIVPEFTIAAEVDMEAAVAVHAQREATYTDLIVKAAALALREVPRANGAYRDGRFELYGRVNVGVAVSGENGLFFPTIFDADEKDLATIGSELRGLAERARAGVITSPEVSGGTFTVSNLGMHGVTELEPVINHPQAAALAAGAIRRLPRVVDDAIVPRHVLALTLVCDHRILYGTDAARFLARIRHHLEDPAAL